MANQIRGRVHRILPAETNEANGKTYSRQRVIFDCTTYDQYTGEPRSNFPSMEFGGKMLESIAQLSVGDVVTVSFALDGRFYTDRNTGEEKHFTSIRGYKIEVVGDRPAQGNTPASEHALSPTGQRDVYQDNPTYGRAQPLPPAEDADDLPF